jgi:periplasmic divalent cation tolerance protein
MAVSSEFLQVQTTLSGALAAREMAQQLVERRLAACAQVVGPIHSTYHWHGDLEHSDEWLLLLKTSRAKFDSLSAAIRELHSYETPEIIATEIVGGDPDYLAWLDENVR